MMKLKVNWKELGRQRGPLRALLALALLAAVGGGTVTSIGQELHFYSTQHFANTFRRIIGKYPKDFRLTPKADQCLEDV